MTNDTRTIDACGELAALVGMETYAVWLSRAPEDDAEFLAATEHELELAIRALMPQECEKAMPL